jgi:hypothetical protein
VDVRNDVYEENLYREGVAASFNNWNRDFVALYEHARRDSDVIFLTGDLIDYGRGHWGLEMARHLGRTTCTMKTGTGSSSTISSPRKRTTPSPSIRSSGTTTGASTRILPLPSPGLRSADAFPRLRKVQPEPANGRGSRGHAEA